jgi:hypothetical protein
MAGGESYGGIAVPEGDPGALEASASRLQATAGVLETTAGALNGLLGGLGWLGPASAQHASLTQSQGLMATTATGTMRQQAGVIAGYAVVLEQAQRAAKKAIEHAKDADRRIDEAEVEIREAEAAQRVAEGRIIAAQNAKATAQMHLFTSATDALLGTTDTQQVVAAAEAEEADARRDLEHAQERERRARRRLEAAREDRREAQRAGDAVEETIGIARTGLVAAAQGAGLLPTQPGGPADPAFAAAAGIELPKPPPPPEHKSWFERRLDDVGDAASWTWDQAKQVPGGVWEGTKGIYEGGKFLYELNPTNPQNLMHPDQLLDKYKQLGTAGKYAFEHPGEFGKQLINWEDLSHGRYGEWAGNLVPDLLLAIGTGGAGTAVSRGAKVARATDRLAEGSEALSRAQRIKAAIPTREYKPKTFAAHAGDDGRISISGQVYDSQQKALARHAGEDPSLLETPKPDDIRKIMDDAGRPLEYHPRDKLNNWPDGTYNATHAEMKLVLRDPDRPVGVTKIPCDESCDPSLQHLAQNHFKQDILVTHPGGARLYTEGGGIVPNATPFDFTGINSRWPGLLSGTGAGAAGLGLQATAP